MKKTLYLVALLVLIVIGALWYGSSSNWSKNYQPTLFDTAASSPVPVSENTKVSNSLSEYQNAELGFSIKYPNIWEREETNSGVTFIIPIDKNQVSTAATLQAGVQVLSGVCAFPPVTIIKDKGTLSIGNQTLNMIAISNTVQGRGYFDRMYSLQSGQICYMFHFSSITLSPSSKGFSGSQLTQATNNNKAIVSAADAAFTDTVKSFAFVAGPQGIDETQAAPAK